jgi:hypothetical protein
VLDRLAIELRSHGGHLADGLVVTYEQFVKHGIDRHSIGPAIREVVALGFVKIVRQGRGGNAEFRQPTLYQTTFLTTVDDIDQRAKRLKGMTLEAPHDIKREDLFRPDKRVAA